MYLEYDVFNCTSMLLSVCHSIEVNVLCLLSINNKSSVINEVMLNSTRNHKIHSALTY